MGHSRLTNGRGPFLLDLCLDQDLADVHVFYRFGSNLIHGGEASSIMESPDSRREQGVRQLIDGPSPFGISIAATKTAASIAAATHSYVLAGEDLGPLYGKAINVGVELRQLAIG